MSKLSTEEFTVLLTVVLEDSWGSRWTTGDLSANHKDQSEFSLEGLMA